MRIGRIVGQYDEGRPGPLLLVCGALHGNEVAGIKAIERLVHLLKLEAINNKRFRFYGRFVGFVGNLEAFRIGSRYIDTDLNRIWEETNLPDSVEKNEMNQIKALVAAEIANHQTRKDLYLLDLHTTSSPRGIFIVPSHGHKSVSLAMHLHCPVITNVIDELRGSMIAYFGNHEGEFAGITSLAFEAGQHDKSLSVTMSVAAIINCMRTIGCVDAAEVEGKHDDLLEAYAEGLPGRCKIVYKHSIQEGSKFEMLPGFEGFQKIEKGQVLAYDDGQPIMAPMTGRILMPLYQKLGKEGFFIVQEE